MSPDRTQIILALIPVAALVFIWFLFALRRSRKPPIDGDRIPITEELRSKAVAIQREDEE